MSEMTPRRKDNNFSASDNEDYGEISDAEVDFNIFRYTGAGVGVKTIMKNLRMRL